MPSSYFTFIIDYLFIVFCYRNYAQEKEIILTLKYFLNNQELIEIYKELNSIGSGELKMEKRAR